jgi:hypothetical protein
MASGQLNVRFAAFGFPSCDKVRLRSQSSRETSPCGSFCGLIFKVIHFGFLVEKVAAFAAV